MKKSVLSFSNQFFMLFMPFMIFMCAFGLIPNQ